jgi:hypothetical protein
MMIDVVGEMGIEISQRVIRQRAQMGYRIEAAEIGNGQISEILSDCRDLPGWIPEIATGKQVRIEPDDFVAGRLKDSHGNGADVTLVARQ